jgi:hypothetical protein
MLRTFGAFVVVAVAASAVGAQAAPQPSVRVMFRTPSGNIGCAGSVAPRSTGLPSVLRCDILSGLRPRPRGPCELDWTGYTFQGRGQARPTCAGDTVYDARAPVLRYGKTWKPGPFTCTSRRTGLRCTNTTGHGFVLARARSHRF